MADIRNIAAGDGNSPSSPEWSFFDGDWYLQRYPRLAALIGPGKLFSDPLAHYAAVGFRSLDPHWLFSEEAYLRDNRDLNPFALDGAFSFHVSRLEASTATSNRKSPQYRNGYDHFLQKGDHERRPAHPFFDGELFTRMCLAGNVSLDFSDASGPMAQFLGSGKDNPVGRIRTSWYFDPLWYLKTYPEVEKLLAQGEFSSPLHHYLTNRTPQCFSPNPDFDEPYYLTRYADVGEIVENGGLRSGFEHFLRFGLREGRLCAPHGLCFPAEILGKEKDYALTQEMKKRRAPDLFALHIARREMKETIIRAAPLTKAQQARLQGQRVQLLERALVARPLFSGCSGKTPGALGIQPLLSVILYSKGNYLSALETLNALSEHYFPGTEIIFVSQGGKVERKKLRDNLAAEAPVIFIPGSPALSREKLLFQARKTASAQQVLFLEAGDRLQEGALESAVSISGNPGEKSTSVNAPRVMAVVSVPPIARKQGGYQRILQTVDALCRRKYRISLLPLQAGPDSPLETRLDLHKDAELLPPPGVMGGDAATKSEMLPKALISACEILWIFGEPEDEFIRILLETSSENQKIIWDTGGMHDSGLKALEAEQWAQLSGSSFSEEEMQEKITANFGELASRADMILTPDPRQREKLRALFAKNEKERCIEAVPFFRPSFPFSVPQNHANAAFARFKPELSEKFSRIQLRFASPVYAPGDRNHDGFEWFVLQAMPLVLKESALDWEIIIESYEDESVDLGFYGRFVPLRRQNVHHPYTMDKPEGAEAAVTFLIVPARVASGGYPEILEAFSQKTPVIAQTPVCDLFRRQDGKVNGPASPVLDGGWNDPAWFAQSLLTLSRNAELRRQLTQSGALFLEQEGRCDPHQKIMDKVLAASGETGKSS